MKLMMVDGDGAAILLDPAVEGSATTARMLEIFARCIQLQRKKAKTYGDAFRSQGYMGNVARVLSKSSRLKNILWNDFGQQLEDVEETTYDTLLDMINLACFVIINREDGNKWGTQI